ncbi:magnesium transporter CorA family protein [Curvibacter sp. CHRR-16]|uniref:magnesium transporter CorA family protein n=1 Tax=Curvibacter sp. CHRR-16 TaxID=2835872 RepID=UPI001BD9B26B|nr:magnesium transporter CorA family protein [Curvibacter sp. CHRR-16]MBT0570054.1 magnesium transporter CorA family protein [Curvibacter sp. CHRR-16]
MRTFFIGEQGVTEQTQDICINLASNPNDYIWLACTRNEFESNAERIQGALLNLGASPLLDLHVSDLLNHQLPSHHDFTSNYDIVVFRRLASYRASTTASTLVHAPIAQLQRCIDTQAVGFAVFDRVLLSVHPDSCSVLDSYASKLLQPSSLAGSSNKRLPTSSADLMLRIINLMVDGYLGLRKDLTTALDHWQNELLNPHTRFHHWTAILDARMALHQLDDVCEDQRACIQDWIEATKTWPIPETHAERTNLELLQVRSRDVLEHIERVIQHVRKLEQSAEAAVQIHFSVQGNRTNDIMRTLTVLTAIFLPLNLIASIFGMNFDFIPLLHKQTGFWWILGLMAICASGLTAFFWRKRYLSRTNR